MIYLDNAATTRPCAEAVAAVNDALTARWGNPSAVHRLGIEAARLLRTARQDVAEAMGAETERVFFTSGGTEADNWAIFSLSSFSVIPSDKLKSPKTAPFRRPPSRKKQSILVHFR